MKTLPPQQLSLSQYKAVRDQISDIFYQVIFQPLLSLVGRYNAQVERLENSASSGGGNTALLSALRSGLVQYKDGIFSGKFNRSVSADLRRMGARFDPRGGIFWLADADVPADVKFEAVKYTTNLAGVHKLMADKLDEMQAGLERTMDLFEVKADSALLSVKGEFERLAKGLEVTPQITEGSWEILKEEYTENLKLAITDFSGKAIEDLREAVRENTMVGWQFDKLARHIQDRFKTSAARADFLARTETSIFMSKFREVRFSEAGVCRYIWRTAGDARVRDDHKHLNGRIFFYSDPPIADVATGTRSNPGAIWNCRCMDEPVLEPLHAGDPI